MGSIRPLITITILVVVGAFLYTKINEGPAKLTPAMNDALQNVPANSVPPLAAAAPGTSSSGPATLAPAAPSFGSTPMAGNSMPTLTPPPAETPQPIAPAMPAPNSGNFTLPGQLGEAPPAGGAPANTANAVPPVGNETLPAIPQIPELPTPVTPVSGGPATAPPANSPIALPENIPSAQYPGSTPATSGSALGQALNSNPTPTPTAPSAGIPSVATESFTASWPGIQTALDRRELTKAHQMLSHWYGNPALSPTESQQVESLLNQLAGTVVYSTEHRLEPPYVVHNGDTLETIAKQYEVPWQLLAKINGVPAADQIRPGQELKVLHGPFSAVIDLSKNDMTLMLDDRYAGRFHITAEAAATGSEGQWVVEQKLANPSLSTSAMPPIGASAAPAAIDHVLVLRKDATGSGMAISITGGSTSPSGPTAVAPAAIRMAPTDVDEIADILSVGSHITIRR